MASGVADEALWKRVSISVSRSSRRSVSFGERADAVEHLAPQAAGVRHVLALAHQPAVELHQVAQVGEAMYKPKPSAAIRNG